MSNLDTLIESSLDYAHLTIRFLIFFVQVGKRVLMFSYGSGLTATMFSLQFNEGQQPFSLSNIAAVMDVANRLKSRHEVFTIYSLSVKRLSRDGYVRVGSGPYPNPDPDPNFS